MVTTSTKVNTKTKVIVGLLLAAGIITAFAAGWMWKVTIGGVSVVNGNTASGTVNTLQGGKDALEFIGDGFSSNTSFTNANANTNTTNTSNSNTSSNTNTSPTSH